jgi:hypothetical protein
MSRMRPTTSSSSTSSWPLRWLVDTVASAGNQSRVRATVGASRVALAKYPSAEQSNTSSKKQPIYNNQHTTSETVSATGKQLAAATTSARSPFQRISPTTTPVFPRFTTTNPTQAAYTATTQASTPVK